MRHSSDQGIWSVLVLCLATLAFTGCSRSNGPDPESPPPASLVSDPDTYLVDHPERFPLCSVEASRAFDQLSVDGVVAPDVSLTVHVTSLAGGRVVDVRAKLGDDVQKGQVLVVINSQDLALAISDYQKFQADELLARRALERAQDLYAHGAVALKDLQQAEEEEQKSKVDLATSKERVLLLGGDLNHPSATLEVRSPISGTIVEQNIAGGEGVKSLDNSPNLFTVADLSRVWVLCDVFEDSLSRIRPGDLAEVKLEAFPERLFKGTVNNISHILDPSIRSAKARIVLENREGLLRPGMFAVVRFTSQRSEVRMVVPASALLRLHDKDWVFRAEGKNQYRRLEVTAGSPAADGSQFVLSGISLGDRIVQNALQFISAIGQK